MAITWNESTMSTGDAEIDAQHRVLINKVNELLELMRQGRGKDALLPMLDFLAKYAQKHFAHEESCMNRHRCPAAATNKAAHAEFLRLFGEVRRRVEAGGVTTQLLIDVQQNLTAWLTNHIVRVDTQLKPCLAAGARS